MEKHRETVAKGLSSYLGIPVIRSDQNSTPPPYPYISYTITTIEHNSGTWGEYDDGKLRKPFYLTWSIKALSESWSESISLAHKAKAWLDYGGKMFLSDNGVTVQSVGNVADRSSFLTVEYEYSYGFDAVFWCMDEMDNPIVESGETIESVVINDEINLVREEPKN